MYRENHSSAGCYSKRVFISICRNSCFYQSQVIEPNMTFLYCSTPLSLHKTLGPYPPRNIIHPVYKSVRMWTRVLPHIPLVQVAGGHQFGQPVNVFSAARAPDCGSAIYPKLECLKDRMLECCWGRKNESRGLMGIL